MKFRELRRIVKSDFHFAMGSSKGIKNGILMIFFNPKFQLIFNYRVSVYLEESSFGFLNIFTKYINLIVFSSEISPRAVIGEKFNVAHTIGLVIGQHVVIGDNVLLYQNVTIGAKNRREEEYPILNNGVVVFANSTIVGGIEISENITIGANSLVIHNCTNIGSIYAGVPAKQVKIK